MASAQPAGYQIQREARLTAWADAHPEHREAIMRWIAMFKNNPFERTLQPLEIENSRGETIYEYVIPGVPIVIAMLIEKQPDEEGVRWARLLRPNGPDDVVPPHEMI